MTKLHLFIGFLCCALLPLSAFAADDDWGSEPEGPSAEDQGEEGKSEDDSYLAGEEEKKDIPDPVKDPSKKGLHENPDDKIYAVGMRLRWIMIPEWVIKMFGVDTMQAQRYQKGTPLISNVGVGPEFIFRRGGLDITAAIWYAGLGWDPISIKKEGEGDTAWSVIENDWRSILFTADFIWSTSFTDWFALTYGVGLGFGVKWGQIVETEATAGSQYLEKCDGYNDPFGDIGCAEPDGDYGKEIWPAPIIPWFEILLGARFKPHKNVSIYVDGGFNLVFQVGMRVQYIF